MAKEIVTLQIGHYANFIGTHWWNLQESSFVYDSKTLAEYPKEVSHDVLFREGKTRKGEITFTPRLVLFDLNHSLGSLKSEGSLYDAVSEEDVKWTGDVTLHETTSVKKNKFLQDLEVDVEEIEQGTDATENNSESDYAQLLSESKEREIADSIPSKSESRIFGHDLYDLDDDVDVWSDFLRTALHPRSMHIFTEQQHNNSEQPFNIFGVGQQLVKGRSEWDAVEDRIRYFTEECDQLQGFQIMLDNYNAFGGTASSVLSYLADEYSTKSRFSFAVTPACPPDVTAIDRSARIINSCLSLHQCADNSSLYVPLCLASSLWKTVGHPVEMAHLNYKPSLNYHTSAILAASLDTATMPYRREEFPCGISAITSSFSSAGRKVAALNTTLPFPMKLGDTFADSLMGHKDRDPWVSLTPHVNCSSSPNYHSCVVRGIPSNLVKSPSDPGSSHRLLSACSSIDDVLRLYLTETFPRSLNAGCVMRDGLKVVAPYPHIFKREVNYKGFLTSTERPESLGVEAVPAMTSLQSSEDVYSYIDSLHGCASRFNISRHQHFIEAGLEPDDFTEALDGLKELAQNYRDSDCL